MSCLEVWTELRLPSLGCKRKEKVEKEGEEYIDFYWKFEAAKADEAARTLTAKKDASKRKRLPMASCCNGVKKFEDIYAWLQSQQDPKTEECKNKYQTWRGFEEENCEMIMLDPKIGSYSPKKAEALYLKRLSRPEEENYDPTDPYSSFFFPLRSQQSRASTLPLVSSISSSCSLQSISSLSSPPFSISLSSTCPSYQSSTPVSMPSSLSSLV